MSSYSECLTELYDLIRPASNNCIPRPNKLDLQSCWKDMKFAKISPAIPTSLNGETQGTFIQRQISSDHSFSSNINEGSPPFRCGRAASQIYPCDVRSWYWPYINPNTLTLSYPMFMVSNRYTYISVTGKRLLMLQNFPHLISCHHFWTLFPNTLLHFPT